MIAPLKYHPHSFHTTQFLCHSHFPDYSQTPRSSQSHHDQLGIPCGAHATIHALSVMGLLFKHHLCIPVSRRRTHSRQQQHLVRDEISCKTTDSTSSKESCCSIVLICNINLEKSSLRNISMKHFQRTIIYNWMQSSQMQHSQLGNPRFL